MDDSELKGEMGGGREHECRARRAHGVSGRLRSSS